MSFVNSSQVTGFRPRISEAPRGGVKVAASRSTAPKPLLSENNKITVKENNQPPKEPKWRSLVPESRRKDLYHAAVLTSIATIPQGGLLAVAMANDSGEMSPYLEGVQRALLPYAVGCSFLLGLIAAPFVVPAAWVAYGIGETVGRIPVPTGK